MIILFVLGAYLSTTDPCSDLKETPDIYTKVIYYIKN
jgi:hypothetical protein